MYKLRFLADRCNVTFGYCHEMSSVCRLSSVVCNTRVLWPNGFMDQDATWYRGRPRPTSVPSGILIHETVWPQYMRVTDDRQTDDISRQ